MTQTPRDPLQRIPPISYPPELPVVERRDDIARAIAGHQVVIVAGETGSGKTTQLPKLCLELGRGREGRIGHTQPRRLAARTVAQRIAEELGTPLGDVVGYQVRFTDQVSEHSAIKLMTDGILLAEIQRDRLLRRYDTLILDEAHERSLNIDFLLGYLKRLLPRRPDLKLVITSATIDVESFSRHFDGAPVIEVSGRSFPVETVYIDPTEHGAADARLITDLVQAIDAGDYGRRGDILVFLSGERDIRETAKLLRRHTELDVLPLYARLSRAEQNRVFDLSRRRGVRVVLATNVAETSLTVPGIRYVIDPGEARISRYNYRTKVQRLPIEPISQASANQRKGRCGRVAAGVCLRLYSEADFVARPEFTDPEIQRTNLAAVILQMLTLGLGAVEDFPFIDPPDPRLVRDGYRLLEELGAVDEAGAITGMGRRMARLPVDPRLARMVLAAAERGSLSEVLVIVSALAVQDPRERPADRQTQADQAHARFRHPKSDFMAWLNLWRYYEEQRQSLSQSRLRKLCQREFLSFLRMREWRDIHYQLTVACRQQQLRPRAELPAEEDYPGVHSALLTGLLGNIAQWKEERDYLGARNRKLQIFPGSSQSQRRPKWLVAAEIVETSRVFAREVAEIDPAWVLQINPSQLKHHYYEPRWQPRRGRAVAYQRTTLYGLTLVDRRTVHYGPIAPGESRELLIREGLVAGRYPKPPPFLRHNLRLAQQVRDLESRARRRDLLADDEVLFAFYHERLPPSAWTAGRLQSWLKRHPEAEASLRVSRELLLSRDPGEQLGEQFPDSLETGELAFRLSYRFEPGGATDGVTVEVPIGLINRVPRRRFDWLVPGLLREKCIALVRALPKELRKKLVPVPDYVDRALASMQPGDTELVAELAEALSRLAGERIDPGAFRPDALEDFYRMNVRVVDARGKLLEQGRDLPQLLESLREEVRETVQDAGQGSPARHGLKRFEVDAVPRQWRYRQAGIEIQAYPALVDRGDHVDIELLDYPGEAAVRHRLGVLRLLRLQSAAVVKQLRKQLLRGNEFNLLLATAGLEREALVDDLIDAAYAQACLGEVLPYAREDFEAALDGGKGRIIATAVELERNLGIALEALAGARRLLNGLAAADFPESLADIETQLAALLAPGFQRDTPADWLSQYPRYMKALRTRAERLRGQHVKDAGNTALLQRLLEPLRSVLSARPALLLQSPPAARYRWMLEELRVSLFAQQLGTRAAVSEKRLLAQWAAVEDWLAQNPQ